MANNQGDFRSKVSMALLTIIAVPSIGLNTYFLAERNNRLNEIYEIVVKDKPIHEKQHETFKKFMEEDFPKYTKFQDNVNRKYGENFNDINYKLGIRSRYDIVNTGSYDH